MVNPPDDGPAPSPAEPQQRSGRRTSAIGPGLTYRYGEGDRPQAELYAARLRLTRRCNRACRFCFIPHQESPAEPPWEQLERALAQAIGAGARRVVLTGGEPLLRGGVTELVARARELGAREVMLQTNGILLADRERCRRLVEAGLSTVSVSLPAHREELLERITGVPKSLGKVLAALEHLAGLGVGTNVTHVLCPENVAKVPAFARYLWERGLCGKLCFLFAAPIVPELARPDRVLRFSDGLGPLREALEYCLEVGAPFDGLSERCGLPECLLAGDRRIYGQAVRIVEANRAHDFVDALACRSCIRRDYCYRVRGLYAYLYGVAEFRPILEPGVLGEPPSPSAAVAVHPTVVARASAAARCAAGDADPLSRLLDHVGERLGLTPSEQARIAALDTDWSTVIELTELDGTTARVQGFRARHAAHRGPTVGALEISPRVDAVACRMAARFRGLRAAAFGLPQGGAHGGLQFDAEALSSEALARAVAELGERLGREIDRGQDFLTPHTTVPSELVEAVLRRRAPAGQRVRWLRGRPVQSGGRPVRMPAVSSAVAAAIFALERYRQPAGAEIRYVVWGFGRAGQRIGSLLGALRRPVRLVGCADSRTACLDAAGLDPAELTAHKAATGRLPNGARVDSLQVLAADADVIFLTSRPEPLAAECLDAIRAPLVVDMTAAVPSEAERALLDSGCLFVPAAVATSGPMIAAATELETGEARIERSELERRIARRIADVLPRMLVACSKHGLSMTEALVAVGMLALRRDAGST